MGRRMYDDEFKEAVRLVLYGRTLPIAISTKGEIFYTSF